MQTRKTFHELLRQGRLEAQQTPEVMAVMLGMTSEEYDALEAGTYPNESSLKRLCAMMDWNFYEAQRLIINEMIAPQASPPGVAEDRPRPAAPRDTLSRRLEAVRLETGQSVEIISRLLNIAIDTYQRLEAGEVPPADLLRRIAMVYNWNYHDLIVLQRSEHAGSFQPPRAGLPFAGGSAHTARWRALCDEMEGLFGRVPEADRERVLAQLELIRDTLARHAPTAPANKAQA